MSKIIYVLLRDQELSLQAAERLQSICNGLNPDHITARPSRIIREDPVLVGISNPSDIILTHRSNILFGQTFDDPENWYVPGGSKPDGNYALFRSTGDQVEVVNDILGTKSIWYYKDKEVFIASSSQRAIIQYLGTFEFNHEVIPWMTCNGLLGPGQSWDARIALLPPDSSLILNKTNWNLSLKTCEINFEQNSRTDQQNLELMERNIRTVFSKISIDYSKWHLTLSGGFDSRGILYSLPKKDKNGNSLNSLTWGLKKSELLKGNDAYLARKIATKAGTKHRFRTTDHSSGVSLKTVLDRFFKNGEGRIDHIGGYMDGFEIWKELFNDGIHGIIRGDEVFGSRKFISSLDMKKYMGLTLPGDYTNLNEEFFSKKAVFPKKFRKRKGESFPLWRDRLYQSFLVPGVLSALENLKQPYVEQINPLLSRKIVRTIRTLPDHLRTEKKIIKSYVKSRDIISSYATSPAIQGTKELFRNPSMVAMVKKELRTDLSEKLFEQDLIHEVLTKVRISSEKVSERKRLVQWTKSMIPKILKKNVLKIRNRPVADMNVVGFRLFLILRMVKLLTKDSEVLQDRRESNNFELNFSSL